MLRILSKTFFLFFLSSTGYAQLAPEIPVLPGQFFNFSRLYNPASADASHKAKASSGYQSYTGIRRNRKILFLDAYASLGSKEKNQYKSCLGITVAAQKTGEYINRNRFHFLYSYRLQVSTSLDLIAGASVGIYNSFISINPSGVSYSILSPDGNFSFCLKHKSRGSVTVGANQFFNNRLHEDRELVQLKRFYVVGGDYNYDLSAMVRLKSGILFRVIPENRIYSSFYSIVDYNKVAGAGIIFHENQMGILGSFSRTTRNQNSLGIAFSYHFPLGRNIIINSNTYNISLNILMHRITF